MNRYKALVGQTAVYGVGTVVPRLLNFILLTPLHTYYFGDTAQYGVITEFYAYVVFLMVILTYGLETGFFRFANHYKNGKDVFRTALSSLAVTTGLFLLLVVVFNKSLARVLEYPDHPDYILMVGWIVALDAFTSIPFAYLRFKNKALKFSVIRIVSVVLNILLNFLFLYVFPGIYEKNPGAWVRLIYDPNIGVGYVFISNLVASSFNLVALSKEIFIIRGKAKLHLWKEMILYSLPLLISGLAGTVNEAIDRVMLKQLLPENVNALGQLGIYGANYKLAVLMTVFIQMFRYGVEPYYFARSGDMDAKEQYAGIMKYFIIFTLIIFLFVNFYIEILKYYIASNYHGGLDIVPIVLAANMFLGIYINLSIWYKLTNLTKFGAQITLGGALITILINALFIPRYGYQASAWAHFTCYLSMVIASYLLSRKYYRIKYDLKQIGIYALLTLVLFVIERLIEFSSTLAELAMNTGLFLIFVVYALKKEKPFRIFKRNNAHEQG